MIKKFDNFPFLNESDNNFTVIEFKNIVKDSANFYNNGDMVQWTVDKLKEFMLIKQESKN